MMYNIYINAFYKKLQRNDGKKYKSISNKNGICSWKKIKAIPLFHTSLRSLAVGGFVRELCSLLK